MLWWFIEWISIIYRQENIKIDSLVRETSERSTRCCKVRKYDPQIPTHPESQRFAEWSHNSSLGEYITTLGE